MVKVRITGLNIELFTSLFLGVEKNNDTAKRNYYSSNRWDAAKEILLSEARIEKMTPVCSRKKRAYNKEDTEYWETKIVQSRQARRPPRPPPSTT